MTRTLSYLVTAALLLGLVGCKKEAPPPPPPPPAPAPKVEAPPSAPAPVAVANITLGKAIGADKKVTAASDTFAKGDTIYASIDTTGQGTATLKAKWTFHSFEVCTNSTGSSTVMMCPGEVLLR